MRRCEEKLLKLQARCDWHIEGFIRIPEHQVEVRRAIDGMLHRIRWMQIRYADIRSVVLHEC